MQTCEQREPDSPPQHDLLGAMSAVFAALGRGLLCLDQELHILHASPSLDHLLAPGCAASLVGHPAAAVLGEELFGPGGILRRAFAEGERREGWGTTLRCNQENAVRVSITLAPLDPHNVPGCDPRVRALVVVRPAEAGGEDSSAEPTLFAGLVARSPEMLRIFHLVEQLRHSEATVLLTGESGTGKELVARAIHGHSGRAAGPFVAVNCAALPGELLESELFGHELAQGGTLFLDEVGDLPLPLQVQLLRFLEERTYERVGDSRPRQSEARIIAATSADLTRAVREGRFRGDLYYRLRVVPIEMPPLRQRREDIQVIARHLLQRVASRHGRSLRFDPGALRPLLAYSWPGNVRELENAIEFAVTVAPGQKIHAEDLPVELQSGQQPAGGGSPLGADGDRTHLVAVLTAHRWRREEAARALGISRTTLWRRMRELGLAGCARR